MATVPSGAMIRVVTTCALDMTACSMATGAPSRTARRSWRCRSGVASTGAIRLARFV